MKVWEALVQSQVRFNRVLEEVPEKVWEALVQSHVRFNRVPKKVVEKVPEKVSGEGSGEGLGGFGASQVQQVPEKVAEAKPGQVHLIHGNQLRCFQRLASQHASERFVKTTRCGCCGYHRSLNLILLFFPNSKTLLWGF